MLAQLHLGQLGRGRGLQIGRGELADEKFFELPCRCLGVADGEKCLRHICACQLQQPTVAARMLEVRHVVYEVLDDHPQR